MFAGETGQCDNGVRPVCKGILGTLARVALSHLNLDFCKEKSPWLRLDKVRV